jgi:hypothetical protein
MRRVLSVVVASVSLACFVDSQPETGDTDDVATSTSAASTSTSTMSAPSGSTGDDSTGGVTSDDPTTATATASDGSSDSTDGVFGQLGSAVSWTGGCGEEVAPADNLVFGGAAFTVELWVQITAATDDGWQMLVSRGGDGEGAPAGWTLELAKVDEEHYRLQMCGGAPAMDTYSCVASEDLLTVGAPYHVAAVRTPPGTECLAGNAGCARLYVAADGGPHQLTEDELGFDWVEAAPLRLASANDACTIFVGHVVMDELRIWAAARTVDQLDNDQDKPTECGHADLAAAYTFDDAEGSALVECTGNAPTVVATPDYELVDSPFDE